MVRKGLYISDFHEEAYVDHDFEDGMSQKARISECLALLIKPLQQQPARYACQGFMRVRVGHPSIGDVWVIGSHTQAWPQNAGIRVKQCGPRSSLQSRCARKGFGVPASLELRWKQMWRHIDATIPEGSKLVIAGDMNTETSEVETMKKAAQPQMFPTFFFLD